LHRLRPESLEEDREGVMSTLKVYDMKGAAIGDCEIADGLMVLDRGSQAVRDVVVAYLAGLRRGTASTLRKGEVAGSNKKPWKQKGTGRARAGYRQSPVWRGGGVAFGPHPRSFAKKLNKKVGRLAFRRAFSEKVASGEVKVVDGLSLAEAKTKAFVALMKALGVGVPALFVVDVIDRNVAQASRNLENVEVARASDVSVYQLLRYPTVVVSQAGLEKMKARMESR
jgi:large subunit ribosomal protein L4